MFRGPEKHRVQIAPEFKARGTKYFRELAREATPAVEPRRIGDAVMIAGALVACLTVGYVFASIITNVFQGLSGVLNSLPF